MEVITVLENCINPECPTYINIRFNRLSFNQT